MYYGPANGKIVEDEPMSNLDLAQILGNIVPPKPISARIINLAQYKANLILLHTSRVIDSGTP